MDPQALYAAYRDRVLAYFSAKVGNSQDAEDLCSDVFEQVFRSLPRYDPARSTLNTWVFTIARFTLINHYRRSRRHLPLAEEFPGPEDPEASLIREETLGRLAEILAGMEQEKRDILVLRYYRGLTLTEISRLTGISYGMVKVKHKKALEFLRRQLT